MGATAAAPTVGELVDAGGLRRFLAEHLPHLAGPFVVERIGEGQANLTFLVRGGTWRVVLRRPPRGELPPSAFDVAREYRVMRALSEAGAAVPVPRPYALCEDPVVIGAPFYVMEAIDGVVARGEIPAGLESLDDRRRMSEELADTLIALHDVDWREAGLGAFGRPDGYLARQLRRMRQLWDLAKFRDIPEIEVVGRWLEAHLPPEGGAVVVHGDYKLDNVMFAPESPARLIAVVDWEISTLGDPQADLGWLLYFWRDPGEEPLGLAVSTVMDQKGFLRRGDVLARYSAKRPVTGDRISWYVALAGWKIAIIMEGSYRRFLDGVTDHPAFARLEDAVPRLARRAADAMRGQLTI